MSLDDCLACDGRLLARLGERPPELSPLLGGEVEGGEAEALADAVALVGVEEQGHALGAKVTVAVGKSWKFIAMFMLRN